MDNTGGVPQVESYGRDTNAAAGPQDPQNHPQKSPVI